MKKNKMSFVFLQFFRRRKANFRILRWVFAVMMCLGFSFGAFAQQQKVSIKVENVDVSVVFRQIKEQTRLNFVYDPDQLASMANVTLDVQNVSVDSVLCRLFRGTSFEYRFEAQSILIRKVQKKLERNLVRGVVTDVSGNVMPGVTVVLVGTSVGTVTDSKGFFRLQLPLVKGKLEFSFIGFKKRIVDFSEKTANDTLHITLEEEVSSLDEVIVRAYGTQNKREVVSAISRITSEEIKEIPAASIATLLQGRMAGLGVVNQSGAPGSASVVAVRGFNSLLSGTGGDTGIKDAAGNTGSPLYVVDGIPMHSFVSPVTGTNTLADLDPSTIESVEVLKDAAAASIYGSRAANGVILITTKKGRAGVSSFAANVSYSISRLMEYPEQTGGRVERWRSILWMRNTIEPHRSTSNTYYPLSCNEAYGTYGKYDLFWGSGSPNVNVNRKLQDSLNPFYNNATNWWKYMFRAGKVLNANIQTTGGTDKFQYMLGVGYYDEKGIMINSQYSRVNLIANLTSQPVKQFKIDTRIYGAYMDRSVNSGMNNGRFEGLTVDPRNTSTLEMANGVVSDEWLKLINGTVVRSDDYRAMANLVLTYNIIDGLSLSASANLDFSQANLNKFEPSYLNKSTKETRSSGTVARNVSLNTEELLNYKKSFKEEHNIDFLLGYTANKSQVFSIGGYGKRSPSDQIYYYDPSKAPAIYDYGTGSYSRIQSTTSYASSFTEKSLVSFFGRLGYNYKKRYLMEFSFRRDGSSTFGENNKWANFPSIALGWAFSEEKLIKDYLGHWLDWGKFRVSYGTSGQIFGNEYLAYGVLSATKRMFIGQTGMMVETPVSPNLTWEKSEQWDLGLDLDMLDYRLNMKLDYYYKLSKSLIYPIPMPGDVYGYDVHIDNAMEVTNEGLELELNYDVLRTTAVKWRTKFNISKNWNRFKKSYDGQDKGSYVIGRPMYQIYVYEDHGYYTSEDEVPVYNKLDGSEVYLQGVSKNNNYSGLIGTQKIRDLNGDGQITVNGDSYPAASPLPVAHGGWVNEVTWKGFSLNMLFNYTIGRHMINTAKGSIASTGLLLGDLRDYKFWDGIRNDYNFVRMGSKYEVMVRSNIENVSSVSLKQLTLGYDLPKNLLQKTFFKEVRLFATGEDLFYLSNYSGLNPEVVNVYTGLDSGNAYPLPRKWTLGLTVKF